MNVFTKITGDKAVDKMLTGLSDKKLKTILTRSLKKIARPIVGAVKNQISSDGMNKTGSFKRSIKLIKSKDKNPAIIIGSKHSIFKFPTLKRLIRFTAQQKPKQWATLKKKLLIWLIKKLNKWLITDY